MWAWLGSARYDTKSPGAETALWREGGPPLVEADQWGVEPWAEPSAEPTNEEWGPSDRELPTLPP